METFQLTLTKAEMHPNYPGFIFLTFGVSEFVIIDAQTKAYEVVAQKQVNLVKATIRPQFIYIHLQNDEIEILKFETKRKQLNSVNKYASEIVINFMYVLQDEQYMLLASNGILHIVSLLSKFSPKIIKSIGQFSQYEFAHIQVYYPYIFIPNKVKRMYIYMMKENIEESQFLVNMPLTYPSHFTEIMNANDQIYLFSYAKYYGVVTYKLTMLFQDMDKFINKAMVNDTSFLINLNSISETVNSMKVSKIHNQLFIAVRSNGVYIYEQTDQNKPSFIQQVRSPNLCSYVSFSDTSEQSILVSDGMSLKVFVSENYEHGDEPNSFNVFNIKQNSLVITNFKMNQFSDRGNIAIDATQNLIFISNSTYISIYSNPDFIYPYSTMRTQQDKNKKIVYFLYLKIGFLVAARDPQEITFYRVNQPSNTRYPFISISCEDCVFQSMAVNLKETLLFVVSVNSIKVYDISDLDLNDSDIIPQLILDFIEIQANSINYLSYLAVNINDKSGFYVLKHYAIVYFSFNYDKEKKIAEILKIKMFLVTDVEYLAYDIRNYDYLFVSSGSKGIIIFDCSLSDMKVDRFPSIIQTVPIEGWITNFHQSPYKPNVLIVNQSVGTQISIIKVDNLYKAMKIYEINFTPDEFIYQSVFYDEESNGFLALATNKGFRYCPIQKAISFYYFMMKQSQINQIKIKSLHNIENINNLNDNMLLKNLEEQNSSNSSQITVQVNDISEIRVAPIFSQSKIYFSNVFLHQNYQMISPPPSWISYDQNELLIKVQPPKESQNYNSGELIIILQIYQSITPSYFVRIYPIKLKQSEQIYELFVKYELIDKQGMFQGKPLQNLYYLENDLRQILKNLSQSQLAQALELISFSYKALQYFYPIQFKVVSSLSLNPFSENVVSTLENSCTLTIQIVKKNNSLIKLYVKPIYDHIIISYNQDKTSITLEGDLQQINQIITKYLFYGIKYNQKLAQLNPDLYFQVSDQNNFPVEQSIQMINATYINEISHLQNSIKLSDQFNSQYSSGLAIKEYFDISFDQKSFINSDFTQIKYKAYIVSCKENDGTKQEICNNSKCSDWIIFDAQELRIYGEGGIVQYKSSYCILIEAFDEFGSVSDNFEMEFNKLPIQLILITSFMVILFAVSLTIIFLMRKKIQKYLYFFQYTHSSIQINIKQTYFKCIFTSSNTLNYSRILFKLLKQDFYSNIEQKTDQNHKNISNQSYKQSFAFYFSDELGDININKLSESAYECYKKNKSLFPNLYYSSFTEENSQLRNALFSLLSLELINVSQAEKSFQQLKKKIQKSNYYQDWYRELLDINEEDFKADMKKIFQNKQEFLEKDFLQNQKIQINKNMAEEILQNNIKQKKQLADKRYLKIIENGLKALYFGYNNTTAIKDWKCNIGNTLHIKINKVYQVEIYEKVNDPSSSEKLLCFFTPFLKERFFYSYKTICCNKILDPQTNFPRWFSIMISNNCILMKLSPRRANVGEYIILLKHIEGYTIHSFGVSFTYPKSPVITSNYNNLKKVDTYNISEVYNTVQIPEEDNDHEEDDEEEEDNGQQISKNKYNYFNLDLNYQQTNFTTQQSPLSKFNLAKQRSINFTKQNSYQEFNKQETQDFNTQTNYSKIQFQDQLLKRQPTQLQSQQTESASLNTITLKNNIFMKQNQKSLHQEQSFSETFKIL